MTEKCTKGEKDPNQHSKLVSTKKRTYCTPELVEETVFERAVLAACKNFGIDPSCEGFPS